MKHLLAITIALLPSAVLAEQFTPQQMLDVMTKSPSNRDVRVHDPPSQYDQTGSSKCFLCDFDRRSAVGASQGGALTDL